MAKQEQKKSPEEASNLFHNIMKASVTGNAPVKISEILSHIHGELVKAEPEYKEYLIMQVGGNELHYIINYNCPAEKAKQIEKVLLENAAQLGLVATAGRMAD
jgi:tartrate dehydratase alpha subunit/fumarate hydratase class I-like protein